MARDHRKLRIFQMADELCIEVYRATANYPREARYGGLQGQTREAAVSAAANIVEGCARRTTRDYLHFLVISLSSASECLYELNVGYRLGYLAPQDWERLDPGYMRLIKSTQNLIDSLDGQP